MFVTSKKTIKSVLKTLQDGLKYNVDPSRKGYDFEVISYYIDDGYAYLIVANTDNTRYRVIATIPSGQIVRANIIEDGKLKPGHPGARLADFGLTAGAIGLMCTVHTSVTECVQIEAGHQVADTSFNPWSVVFVGTDGNSVVLERAKDKKNILIRNTDKDAVKSFGLVWKAQK